MFNALSRIITEEGLLTLWRGCGPTIIRAMVVNAAQLASYSQAKQGLMSTGIKRRLNDDNNIICFRSNYVHYLSQFVHPGKSCSEKSSTF